MKFKRCVDDGEPLPAVERVEQLLGIRFPSQLRDLFLTSAECHIAIHWDGGVLHGDLLSLSIERFEYVSSLLMDRWQDEFKDKYPLVVPFASCGDGDLHCLDYRASSEPCVVLWMLDMAYGDESPFKPIARTMEDYAARSTFSHE